MKNLILIMAALVGLVLTACSSDEPSIEINNDVVESYREGSVTKYFKLTDSKYYLWDEENSKWVLYDEPLLAASNSDTGSSFNLGFSAMLFTKGQVWTPLETYQYNPDVFWWVWGAYQKVTHNNNTLYLAAPFIFKEDERTMSFRGYTFNVKKMTKSKLEVCKEHFISTDGGASCNKYSKTESAYELADLSQSYIDNIITFESQKEAYLYIIKVAKAQFGDKVNINEIYQEKVLGNPIVDLKRLEEMVENGGYFR